MDRRSSVYILVTAVALANALLALFPQRRVEPDDQCFYYGMRIFSRGRLVLTPRELAREQEEAARRIERPIPPGWVRTPKGMVFEKSPGYAGLLALFHRMRSERLVNPLLSLIAVVLLFWMLRNEPIGGRFAFFSALLTLLNPSFLLMLYRTFMSDCSSAVIVLLSLGLYYVGERDGGRKAYVLSGLFLGLSVIFRYSNLLSYGVIFLYAVAQELRDRRDSRGLYLWLTRRGLWIALGTSLIPLALLAFYSYRTTGSPFRIGYSYTILRNPSPAFSLSYLPRNLLRIVPLLLLGFPTLILVPRGMVLLLKTRERMGVFLLCWMFVYFGTYLCYEWIRSDHFIFQTRFFLPALFPVTIASGAAIASWRERWTTRLTGALLTSITLVLCGDFFARYILGPGEQIGPPHTWDSRPRGARFEEARPPFPELPAPFPDASRKIQRLHRLMEQCLREGKDVSAAKRLDHASKQAFERGDPKRSMELIHQAIRTLERTLKQSD